MLKTKIQYAITYPTVLVGEISANTIKCIYIIKISKKKKIMLKFEFEKSSKMICYFKEALLNVLYPLKTYFGLLVYQIKEDLSDFNKAKLYPSTRLKLCYLSCFSKNCKSFNYEIFHP